ncbi:unnamed protein product [Urochloa humidicola]
MASPKLFTGQKNGRANMPAALAASNAGDLPLDAVYEILVRAPAKSLCRLRTVCRFWRSLLSDPEFAAAHAAARRRDREPPLVIAGYNDYSSEISFANIMDLSGDIVKQVRLDGHRLMGMPGLNLACVRSIADGSCRLVASTEEYKAFRKVTRSRVGENGFLYEVCTLSSGIRPRWRAVQGPPNTFGCFESTGVAIDGLVYLLMADVYLEIRRKNPVIQRDWIYSFDLETEKWRPNIKGPQGFFLDGDVDPNNHYREIQLSLANLNGSLVIVHGPSPNMDIWFLMDSEKGLWVKQYSIHIQRRVRSHFWPLVVLDDGRIVIAIHEREGSQTLEIHEPKSNTISVVADTSHCRAISVYTGNLLSLE